MTDRTTIDPPTNRELAVDLLTAYRNWLGFGAIVLALALAVAWFTGAFPSVPEVPEPAQAAGLAMFGAFALGYLPTARLVDYLYDPPKRYIVCLGLSPDRSEEFAEIPRDAAEPGVYELSPAAWENVICLDGEMYQWEDMKWPTYEVEAFDPESLGSLGTWRGSKPDSELLRREKEIDQLRQDLEKAADQSIDLEIAISSKVREAVKEIGQAIITEHAAAATYNGEKVADVLSEIRQDVEEDTGEDLDKDQRPVRQIRTLETLAENLEVQNGDR